uniref:Uncharacterized protein n=1 Tax=Magallana gigas TaxID=29159 RepID=A0A8W8I250_MAGGI
MKTRHRGHGNPRGVTQFPHDDLIGEFCHNLFIQIKPIPAEPKEYYPPTGVTSPGHWRDSTPTGDCGGNSPLGAHQSDCHNPRRKSSSDSGPNSYLPPLGAIKSSPNLSKQVCSSPIHMLMQIAKPIPAEPKEYYPPTGVTSPGHWRDSTPTGDCGGNSPLGAHQSDCHNPRRKSSSDSGPNSYLPPLV